MPSLWLHHQKLASLQLCKHSQTSNRCNNTRHSKPTSPTARMTVWCLVAFNFTRVSPLTKSQSDIYCCVVASCLVILFFGIMEAPFILLQVSVTYKKMRILCYGRYIKLIWVHTQNVVMRNQNTVVSNSLRTRWAASFSSHVTFIRNTLPIGNEMHF